MKSIIKIIGYGSLAAAVQLIIFRDVIILEVSVIIIIIMVIGYLVSKFLQRWPLIHAGVGIFVFVIIVLGFYGITFIIFSTALEGAGLIVFGKGYVEEILKGFLNGVGLNPAETLEKGLSTIIGFFCLTIAISILALWIYSFGFLYKVFKGNKK
jgi:hypothetical protein